MRYIFVILIMIALTACSQKAPKKQVVIKPAQEQVTKTSLLKAPPSMHTTPKNPTQEAYKERVKQEWMQKRAATDVERELQNRRLKAATGIDMEEHSPLDEILDAVLNTP